MQMIVLGNATEGINFILHHLSNYRDLQFLTIQNLTWAKGARGCTHYPRVKEIENFNSSDWFHSNKCTDPDGTGYPWCYTTTSVRWNRCDKEGDTASISGPCQRWDCHTHQIIPNEIGRLKKLVVFICE